MPVPRLTVTIEARGKQEPRTVIFGVMYELSDWPGNYIRVHPYYGNFDDWDNGDALLHFRA